MDVREYAQSNHAQLEAKYGLPSEVRFCRRCVISNQRPNSAVEFAHTSASRKATIQLNEEGVCDACLLAEIKHTAIDWAGRAAQLKALCDRFRRDDGRYDCIVPGSGGKDSFYAAHVLKYEYGMHPLTVTWAPHVYTEWGWKNHQAWIHAGFDNVLFTPNGRVHRLLTRLAVENLLHPFQAFMLGQKNLAPKMALLYDVPLVFFGENEAEYGNPIQDMTTARRDWSYFAADDKSKMFLGGTAVSELIGDYGVDQNDLLPYLPANPQDIEKHAIEVHYLGYYLSGIPKAATTMPSNTAAFRLHRNARPAPTANTTASTTASTTSTTSRRTSSSVSAARRTTPPRRYAPAISRAMKAWRWSGASTANIPSALQKRYSGISACLRANFPSLPRCSSNP
ncbi:MAG TPA: N-acetyl sugar amidotransferase [Burkholderiales bacterium]|nr:N-acetyl sugar amidotransferase [Burkholderiales bacterium]